MPGWAKVLLILAGLWLTLTAVGSMMRKGK